MNTQLLPCAHCGSPAKYGEGTDTENFGGQYIECTNLQCGMSTCIMFPAMCSVKEDLAERWNTRTAQSLAQQAVEEKLGLVVDCERLCTDLEQSLRQWKMYAEEREGEDLENESHAEALSYRAAVKTAKDWRDKAFTLAYPDLSSTPTEGRTEVICDGRTFNSPLDAALHLLWLLQRLSYFEPEIEGMPCDGFRFREGIIAARKLLTDLDYERETFGDEAASLPASENLKGEGGEA